MSKALCFAFLLAALAGCAGTTSGATGPGTQVWPLDEEDAVLVMREAMRTEFGDDAVVEDVFEPARGYRTRIRFMADVDIVGIRLVATRGRGPEGTVIDGIAFETWHDGTYPAGGIPRSHALLEATRAGADTLAGLAPD